MKILDLFCGIGGAALGMAKACTDQGLQFEIFGVDMFIQPDYPFAFLQADIRKINPEFCKEFDFIWASPPCQSFSITRNANPKEMLEKEGHQDCLKETKYLLGASGKDFCIQNVQNSPLRGILLCGSMFNLRIIRHRVFETNFLLETPYHGAHGDHITIAGNGFGRGKTKISAWQDAMQIWHTKNRKGIANAVPPAYSNYVFLQYLKTRK